MRLLVNSLVEFVKWFRRRKGEFGVLSVVNVDLAESEAVATGQPVQTHVTPILSFGLIFIKEARCDQYWPVSC